MSYTLSHFTNARIGAPFLETGNKFYPVEVGLFNGDCWQWERVEFFPSKAEAKEFLNMNYTEKQRP